MDIHYKHIKIVVGVMITVIIAALLVNNMYGADLSSSAQEELKRKEAQYQLNDNFLSACRWGDVDSIKECLTAGADLEFNKNGTGLGWAAYWGYTESVALLLNRKANINTPDDSGRTPLMNALMGGNISTWIEVLKHEPDLNITDNEGYPALIHEIAAGNIAAVEALLLHGADISRPEGMNNAYEILKRITIYIRGRRYSLTYIEEAALRELLDNHRSKLRNVQAQVISAHVQGVLEEITGLAIPHADIIGQYACQAIMEDKYSLPSITQQETKERMAAQAKADAEDDQN